MNAKMSNKYIENVNVARETVFWYQTFFGELVHRNILQSLPKQVLDSRFQKVTVSSKQGLCDT